MRIYILGLALALAGLWPQIAWGRTRYKPQPPALSWSGLIPTLTGDCFQGHDLLSGRDSLVVFVAVKGINISQARYQVTLSSAGPKVKAEAETCDGLALFTVAGDFPLQRNLTIKVTESYRFAWNEPELVFQYEPDLIANVLANVEESNFVYIPRNLPRQKKPARSWVIYGLGGMAFQPQDPPLPLSVEIVLLRQNQEMKTKELPGFFGKSGNISKSRVLQRFQPDLVPKGMNFWVDFFGNMNDGEAYFTKPFSLKVSPHEKTRAKRWSGSAADLQPLAGILNADQNLGIEDFDIQPVDWRKGKASDFLNPGLWDEYPCLLPLDEQKPEVIIIRKYPEPQYYEDLDGSPAQDSRKSLFSFWISLFR